MAQKKSRDDKSHKYRRRNAACTCLLSVSAFWHLRAEIQLSVLSKKACQVILIRKLTGLSKIQPQHLFLLPNRSQPSLASWEHSIKTSRNELSLSRRILNEIHRRRRQLNQAVWDQISEVKNGSSGILNNKKLWYFVFYLRTTRTN